MERVVAGALWNRIPKISEVPEKAKQEPKVIVFPDLWVLLVDASDYHFKLSSRVCHVVLLRKLAPISKGAIRKLSVKSHKLRCS